MLVINSWEESLCRPNFSVNPEKKGETEKAPSSEKEQRCRNESRGLGRDVEDRGGGAEGYGVPGIKRVKYLD